MYEARQHTTAPFILYMDDDIAIEPDSILRAVAFAASLSSPCWSVARCSTYRSAATSTPWARLSTAPTSCGPPPRTSTTTTTSANTHCRQPATTGAPADGSADPRWKETADLHRRIDVDYNGWWMCLIPRLVADTIGQPLPLFIKWDDAEFGLRAGAHGFPTVTMPGIAIWHMAWSDKDDAIDWQAYFHLRNRLVVAALTQPEGGLH
ncbi:MAG: glycosyltransferase [Lawsonella clevelandensis]